jgi:hypothetical protein
MKTTHVLLFFKGAFGWVENSYYSGLTLFRATNLLLGVFELANSHYSLFVFCGIAHYSTNFTKYWNIYYSQIRIATNFALFLIHRNSP